MVPKSSWERETCSFIHPDIQKPVRVQGSFVSDEEVQKVVDYLIDKNGNTSYSNELEEQISSSADLPGQGMLSGTTGQREQQGCLFCRCRKSDHRQGKASIGMLQRMFKIGFNRAARIMDQLCEAGVVGPEEGTKSKKSAYDKRRICRIYAESDFVKSKNTKSDTKERER